MVNQSRHHLLRDLNAKSATSSQNIFAFNSGARVESLRTAPRFNCKMTLEENCQHRPVQYLNNVLEQDHRAIKRPINASQHFRSFWGAWRTIAGYEAVAHDPQRPGVRIAPHLPFDFKVATLPHS